MNRSKFKAFDSLGPVSPPPNVSILLICVMKPFLIKVIQYHVRLTDIMSNHMCHGPRQEMRFIRVRVHGYAHGFGRAERVRDRDPGLATRECEAPGNEIRII